MSIKRSRFDRSSTSINPDLVGPISSTSQPIESALEVFPPAQSTVVKRSKCTDASPVEESEFNMPDFLQNCYFCNKKINHTKEIYMYRDCAYCTPECREILIEFDEKMEKQAEEKSKKAQK